MTAGNPFGAGDFINHLLGNMGGASFAGPGATFLFAHDPSAYLKADGQETPEEAAQVRFADQPREEHPCCEPLIASVSYDDVIVIDLCPNQRPCAEHPEPVKAIAAPVIDDAIRIAGLDALSGND